VVVAARHPAASSSQPARTVPIPVPSWCLAGRPALPLEPGGRWVTMSCQQTAGGKRQSQVGHRSDCRPWSAQVAGLVGGAFAAGVGHASTVRPDPPPRQRWLCEDNRHTEPAGRRTFTATTCAGGGAERRVRSHLPAGVRSFRRHRLGDCSGQAVVSVTGASTITGIRRCLTRRS